MYLTLYFICKRIGNLFSFRFRDWFKAFDGQNNSIWRIILSSFSHVFITEIWHREKYYVWIQATRLRSMLCCVCSGPVVFYKWSILTHYEPNINTTGVFSITTDPSAQIRIQFTSKIVFFLPFIDKNSISNFISNILLYITYAFIKFQIDYNLHFFVTFSCLLIKWKYKKLIDFWCYAKTSVYRDKFLGLFGPNILKSKCKIIKSCTLILLISFKFW